MKFKRRKQAFDYIVSHSDTSDWKSGFSIDGRLVNLSKWDLDTNNCNKCIFNRLCSSSMRFPCIAKYPDVSRVNFQFMDEILSV